MRPPQKFYALERPPFEIDARAPSALKTRPLRDLLTAAQRRLETTPCAICVCGPRGVGKSVFGRALRSTLAGSADVGVIAQPDQPWEALEEKLVRDLRLEGGALTAGALARRRGDGRRLVVQVDPAEGIRPESLDRLEGLLRGNRPADTGLLRVVLIADVDRVRSDHPLAAAIDRGLLERLDLRPLPSEDVFRYIAHRLELAGYAGTPLFSAVAAQEVHRRSGGIPADINRICQRALELGAERELRSISAEAVAAACERASAPGLTIRWKPARRGQSRQPGPSSDRDEKTRRARPPSRGPSEREQGPSVGRLRAALEALAACAGAILGRLSPAGSSRSRPARARGRPRGPDRRPTGAG